MMKKISILLLVALFAISAHAQKGKDQVLEALGGSGGLLLYNTYMIVGMTADAYADEVYDADKASQILEEQAGGIGTIKEQYEAVLSSGFLTSDSDEKFLKELLLAFDKVVTEIDALEKYLSTNSTEDAQVYDSFRQDAWAEISRLLDIK